MGSEPATATPGRRGWAVTLLAAAAVAAAVLAVGWSLQAVALPAPARGSLVATQAMSWVAGTDPIESTYTVTGAAPAHSTCVRHELRFADGNVETAALLRTGGKTQVVPVGYPFRNARGVRVGKPQGVELARLALAGCPPVLESLIGGLIKYRADPPRVGETTVAGRKTLTLRIWTKAGQIAVSLAADSKQPLTVTVSGPKLEGRATLTLGAGAT